MRLSPGRLLRRGLAVGTLVVAGVLALAAARSRLIDPEPTVLLLDRRDRFLAEVSSREHDELGYWRLDELPPRVVAATLAAEDRRFEEHPGVDLRAVLRAAWQNLQTGERVSGASTLAMQLARLQDPGPRTWPRKVLEAATALVLTARHGRQEVLRQYLRLAPYGRRVRGVAYAARRYFEKPVEDLTWGEAALLASLPQAPGRMNPYRPESRARARRRARGVLATLHQQGRLDDDELALALDQVDHLRGLVWSERPREAMHPILRMERLLAGRGRERPLVRAALDLELQGRVRHLLELLVRQWRPRGVANGACMVLDRTTGEVLASVGSIAWGDDAAAGSYDFTRVRRSPGSALKPFLYALALDRGVLSPATVLDDLRRAPGAIENADDRFLGPMLPRVALANSRNVPAVNLLARLGVDELHALLGQLGLHDGTMPASHYGRGLALGTLPVTLEDLAGAYLTLTGDGLRRTPAWFRDEPAAGGQPLLSVGTARLVTRFLADPDARLPTFPRGGFLEASFPVAVKTGTSSQNRDAWCVSSSPRYLVAAWLGHPDLESMRGITGYTGPARLACQLLHDLHAAHPGPEEGFPEPPGYARQALCGLSGALAGEGCTPVTEEWLPPGAGPLEPCRVHRRLTIDTRNGMLATAAVPPEHLAWRTYVTPPARHAGWAAATGLEGPPDAVSPLGLPGEAPLPSPLSGPAVPPPRLTLGTTEVAVRITEPAAGLRLFRDPDAPPETSSLELDAEVDPPAAGLVWYVDGLPYRTVPRPYRTRWVLRPGEHVIVARVPYTDFRSPPVRVVVD